MTGTVIRRPPALVLMLALVLAIGATWWLLRSNTSPAVRECLRLYAEAGTTADSLAVDTTVTDLAANESIPRSCGSMRMSSRWQ
jgi:hypothetical protein